MLECPYEDNNIKIRVISFFYLMLFFFACCPQEICGAQGKKGPSSTYRDALVATVNGEGIFDHDIAQRYALDGVFSGAPPEMLPPLSQAQREKIAETLMQESLRRQHLLRINITLSSEAAAEYLSKLEDLNHLARGTLVKRMQAAKVPKVAWMNKLHVDLLWPMYVGKMYKNVIKIDPRRVEEAQMSLKKAAQEVRCRVFEISLMLPEDGDSMGAMSLQYALEDIQKKLSHGVPFAAVAKEYSVSPSAAQGGDLGVRALNTFPLSWQEEIKSAPLGMVQSIALDGPRRLVIFSVLQRTGGNPVTITPKQARGYLMNETLARWSETLTQALRRLACVYCRHVLPPFPQVGAPTQKGQGQRP